MRIVHLSDLHFGRHDRLLAAGLAAEVIAQQPTLVVVSGDFTQSGTAEEFKQARTFLSLMPVPVFAVPGNHDVPALNLVQRLVRPYRLYRKYIDDTLEPFVEIEGVAIAGMKTARRARLEFNWAHGTINSAQLRHLKQAFAGASPGAVRIVVAHHPLLEPESKTAVKMTPVRRAAAALRAFEELGVRAVLSGHFHLSYVRRHGGETREGIPPGPRRSAIAPILIVQAASTISTRLRGEPNAYNLIDVDNGELTVTVRERQGADWVTREAVSAPSLPSAQ
jgi:3',5'-cyclic AMP phosphodiesterase CpdA